ncbi:MAG: RHS repeat-associated core domain-containing protein [Acidobacteria bacterium]|nr:MAG: RHS repeat-associated core domain-containing protein [Acidobacteriota bacterium]
MFQKLLQEVTLGYTTDTVRQKFTGYERDNESELDYAQARYFSYNHGRFTSADPMRESAKADAPQTWNRFSYVVNNPFKYIDPTGKCTAPSGLKPGQVGICFEAFIAARRVGPGGIGHGDGRDFAGNDPSKTARVTVWAIVSTDEKMVYITKSDKVSPSLIGGGKTDNWTIAKTGVTDSPPQSLQGTATTDAKLSNIKSKVGEKDFGAGVDVTVSIANGRNGGQQLGKDLQVTGQITGGIQGLLIAGVGKVIEALSPAGTIDGYMTVRITGNGQVTLVGGESRGYPSYAGYAYTVSADGRVVTQQLITRQENKIEDLTKPMIPFPR